MFFMFLAVVLVPEPVGKLRGRIPTESDANPIGSAPAMSKQLKICSTVFCTSLLSFLCFLGGPGGGFGGFQVGSRSSGRPRLRLPRRKPPKPSGPPRKHMKLNRRVQNTVEHVFYCVL